MRYQYTGKHKTQFTLNLQANIDRNETSPVPKIIRKYKALGVDWETCDGVEGKN